MSTLLSVDESKHLVQLCKVGRLFEIQEWIEAGKSVSVAPDLARISRTIALFPRSAKAVWGKCIWPRTPNWIAEWRSRFCRLTSRQIAIARNVLCRQHRNLDDEIGWRRTEAAYLRRVHKIWSRRGTLSLCLTRLLHVPPGVLSAFNEGQRISLAANRSASVVQLPAADLKLPDSVEVPVNGHAESVRAINR